MNGKSSFALNFTLLEHAVQLQNRSLIGSVSGFCNFLLVYNHKYTATVLTAVYKTMYIVLCDIDSIWNLSTVDKDKIKKIESLGFI